MSSRPSSPDADDIVESPRQSVTIEPGRLWKGEEMMPMLLRQQHTEVMHSIRSNGEKLQQILTLLSPGKVSYNPITKRVPLAGRMASNNSQDSHFLLDDRELGSSKNLPEMTKKSSAHSRHVKAPAKPKRNSFTPQLFKTFSQTDMELRKDAKVASRANISRTETGHAVQDKEGYIERLVKHPAFDIFFTLIVITNSLFIGIELQVSVDNPEGPPPLAIQSMLYLYTFLFLLELVLRTAAGGLKYLFGEEWTWAWLDVFIVSTSLWEVTIQAMNSIYGDAKESPLSAFSSLKAIRIIRITRLVKVSRLVRIFRFVLALRTLIASIIHTLKSLVWALLLLGLIAYVFGILLMQAVNDYVQDPEAEPLPMKEFEASKRYFGTLGDTMLSLFMSVTGGVSWEEVLGPLKAINAFWVVLFLFYICFTHFAVLNVSSALSIWGQFRSKSTHVLNVLTAVFCQSAIDGAQNDHASKVHAVLANKQVHLAKIHELFAKFGAENGVITFNMFQQKINAPEVREYFQTLGLDVWDAWSFFQTSRQRQWRSC